MSYDKQYLIDEINRFIKENNRFPIMKDMLVKNGYPSINAFIETFGSWQNSINAMLDAEIENIPCFDNLICYPYQLEKYTDLCMLDMEELLKQFPRISMFAISTIYNAGYLRGCDAATEAVCIDTLYDLYL